MTTILVVTERALSQADVADVVSATTSQPADLTVRVAVPEHATARTTESVVSSLGESIAASAGEDYQTMSMDTYAPDQVIRAEAQAVVDETVRTFEAAGCSASGEITPHHPLDSVGDAIRHHGIDEVVVMVEHRTLGSLTHSDLASKISKHFGVDALRVHRHG